ncbi:MAG: glutaminyl-peptide cyclotransferase [Spirochaetia bacterium]|nr:glutaminyl-peptide cyclotransferase [Spirochaetia bacterium]
MLRTIPRVPVFTQGLVYDKGLLYESSGNYGHSGVRILRAESGDLVKSVPSPTTVFGEGLALVGDALYQLTWREEKSYTYDRSTLQIKYFASYDGEGWGLAVWKGMFVMTDGSSLLTFRQIQDFKVVSKKKVTLEGEPLRRLNELEVSPEGLLANVWHENFIAVIDPSSGAVQAVIDAENLVRLAKPPHNEAVLNGIAWAPEKESYFVTGKDWNLMFEVRLLKQPRR